MECHDKSCKMNVTFPTNFCHPYYDSVQETFKRSTNFCFTSKFLLLPSAPPIVPPLPLLHSPHSPSSPHLLPLLCPSSATLSTPFHSYPLPFSSALPLRASHLASSVYGYLFILPPIIWKGIVSTLRWEMEEKWDSTEGPWNM